MPGDVLPAPRTLTERMVIARRQLQAARERREPDRELYWQSRLDLLLDAWLAGDR